MKGCILFINYDVRDLQIFETIGQNVMPFGNIAILQMIHRNVTWASFLKGSQLINSLTSVIMQYYKQCIAILREPNLAKHSTLVFLHFRNIAILKTVHRNIT